MKVLKHDELVNAFAALGIERGEIVHVQSDLRRIGLVDAPLTREGVCGFYLDALRVAVGPKGTITCCTSFEDYGRYGTAFLREESPSRTDTFSEYLRTQPGAVRSMHPIVSVTGLGERAQEICGGPHYNGFGYNSPWGRLHRANAKILSLGIDSRTGGGMTFLHFVEASYGVPYQYIKIYEAPVFSGGKRLAGPFTMSVRYLDFSIVNVPFRIKARLLEQGDAREARTGRVNSWCGSAYVIFDRMVGFLDEDRWIYLEAAPAFRSGEVPMDGAVGKMQVHYDRTLSSNA